MAKLIFLFFAICSFLHAIEDVVIIGSGPAGMTAAIYAARSGLKTLLVEGEESGGQIAFSYKIDNFPGFPDGISGEDLIKNMKMQARKFGAEIQSAKVVSIDVAKRPFLIRLEDETNLYAKSLIIASGAKARWLEIPSEAELIGRGVNCCAICDAPFFVEKEVFVVGGGDTALEEALYLANYASKVTIIHRRENLRASPFLQSQVRENKKIRFMWNCIVDEIMDPKKEKVTGAFIENLKTKEKKFYPCDGLFIAIGHTPNTTLFKGKLEIDELGYIVTKPMTTETTIDGVFAAGDVVDSKYKQAITAAASGSMAAMDAYTFIQKQKGN